VIGVLAPRGLAILAALGPAAAAADPVEILAGPELRLPLTDPQPAAPMQLDRSSTGGPVAGFSAAVAVRLSQGLAVGLRGGVTWRNYATTDSGAAGSMRQTLRTIPVDVAIALPLTSGRVWAVPWLGEQLTRVRSTMTTCAQAGDAMSAAACTTRAPQIDWTAHLSWGFTTGIDLWCRHGHCIAYSVDVEAGLSDYIALSFGCTYHY
jgi:hypothetical protein